MAAPMQTREATVIWHDVECGAYAEDLPVWEELAEAAAWGGSPGTDVIDLGAGTGRVAFHLAGRGHRVWALDNDEVLVEAMRERAERNGATVAPVLADARGFDLGGRAALVAAPMQLAHLLDARERASMLSAIAAHLAPGGIAAFALMASMPEPWRAGTDGDAPTPDVRERDAWIFSSLPVAIEAEDRGIVVHRLRQTVSPEGELSEEEHVFRLHALSAEELEAEAFEAGLTPRERRSVAETDDYVGSTIVVVEAER